jgi:hypothetical protein
MDLRQLQHAFAAHLRDPQGAPAPEGVESRRMAVYRELFFNNVRDLLGGTFPVCVAILGADGWSALVRRFYAQHKARTPYFLELPREFVEWLGDPARAPDATPPFLPELAHYEWVELALSIAEDAEPTVAVDPQGDLLEGRPQLSALAWPLAYRWPVHRLSRDYQPAEAPELPTFIVVHRKPSGDVGFLQVDLATARLLELLCGDEPGGGRDLIETIARESGSPDPPLLVQQGAAVLANLRERGIITGTRLAR